MSGLGWFSTAQVQISGFALKVLIQSVKLLRPTTSSLFWMEDVLFFLHTMLWFAALLQVVFSNERVISHRLGWRICVWLVIMPSPHSLSADVLTSPLLSVIRKLTLLKSRVCCVVLVTDSCCVVIQRARCLEGKTPQPSRLINRVSSLLL